VAQRPPSPVSASAPATEFSAERAAEHLRRITSDQPMPIGSAASDAVRDYLVAELASLGFAAEVQKGVGAFTSGADTVAGRVDNVVATLPGRDPTGRVVLAAHYDTTFGSPGAADDKASVAAILETARALTSGQRLRNDVVVLLTDGEEPGMLGAASFAAQHPDGAEGGVLLNWEASGNRGPSVLFETSPGNAELIAAFAASAPHPAGDSAMAALYRAGSQHTDFTVLADEGFVGLNFALIDGVAAYHHPRDTVANLDSASLQQLGASMLGLTRGFGDRDLADIRGGGDATYFTVFGQVVAYPAWLVWPLAVAALVAVAALAILVRRRGLATAPRLLGAAAAALLPLLAAPAAAIGLWQALVWVRPGYAAMFMGDPYRPQLYRSALAALTATILLTWYLTLRRRVGAVPLAVGALVWPAVSGLVTAWLIPAAWYPMRWRRRPPPPAESSRCWPVPGGRDGASPP
jgi:Peptidase family M28